jgi:hypothetical protein
MTDLKVFVSIGGTATDKQESFIRAVEDRLRAEGISPHTVGRNTFSADSPLKAITELMNDCSGAVVIAFERTYYPSGVEKRGGPRETPLNDVRLPTPWNQIEAAMAYSRNLPLMVIVEEGLRTEGLLERGYDWYVQRVLLDSASLNTNEFNGVLASWKHKMTTRPPATTAAATDLTVAQLVGGLKPSQLWSLLAALAALIAGAFTVGAKLLGTH